MSSLCPLKFTVINLTQAATIKVREELQGPLVMS